MTTYHSVVCPGDCDGTDCDCWCHRENDCDTTSADTQVCDNGNGPGGAANANRDLTTAPPDIDRK